MKRPTLALMFAMAVTAFVPACQSLSETIEDSPLGTDFASLCNPLDRDVTWTGNCSLGLAEGQGVATFSGDKSIYKSIEAKFKRGWPMGDVKIIYSDGGSYQGGWHRDNPHGFGKDIEGWGEGYEGRWIHGFRDGEGVFITSDGERTNGLWKKGLGFVGRWYEIPDHDCKFWWGLRGEPQSTATWSGGCEKGKAHGPGEINSTSPDGRSSATLEGEMIAGMIQGRGKLTKEHRATNMDTVHEYSGEWKDGLRSGYGTEILTDKSTDDYLFEGEIRYDGNWKSGARSGRGLLLRKERREHEIKTIFEDRMFGEADKAADGINWEVTEREQGRTTILFDGSLKNDQRVEGTETYLFEGKSGTYVSRVSGNWTGDDPKSGFVKYVDGSYFFGVFEGGLRKKPKSGICHLPTVDFTGDCEAIEVDTSSYSGKTCLVPKGETAGCLYKISEWVF